MGRGVVWLGLLANVNAQSIDEVKSPQPEEEPRVFELKRYE